MNKFIALLSAAFLLVMIFHVDYLEGNDLQLLKELNSNIIKLPGGSPLAYEDKAFLNLDPLFEKAQIIGLGEGTHGTREFFEMKQRLFQYLVKKHKCRALGFEYGFRFQKSLQLEKYVTTGKGNLNSIINELHWIHRNREFLGLIKWMRQYNSDKNKDQMIHFFGIDSQIDTWYQDELSRHFSEISKELHQSVFDILDKLIKKGKIDYRTLNQEAYQEIRDLLYSLKEKTRQFFLRNPNARERWARELLLHNIESHILSHECRFKNYKKEYPRDRHMASHALWLKDLMGGGAKIAIWAHNAHAAKDPHYSRDGSPAMGKYLQDKLGDKYLAIGTAFSQGKFVAVTEDYFGKDTKPIVWKLEGHPPENSINYLFELAKYKNYIFNITDLPDTSILYKHLHTPRPLFGVGDFYSASNPDIHYQEDRIINLVTAYDIIIYLSDTNPITIKLEGSRKK